MITTNKGNLLSPDIATDDDGFSLFEKANIGDTVLLVEGTFPADTLLEVHFKGQSATPTPLYSDYDQGDVLILDKCGKIVLSKCVEGLEIGVKVTDAAGVAKDAETIADFYVGLY